MDWGKKKFAFTLVELLVSLTIIALLLGVAMVSYGEVRRKRTVDFAALDIRDMVVKARTYAISPPKQHSGVRGYVFWVKRDTREYGISKLETNGSKPVLEKKQLPNRIVFISPDFETRFQIVEGGKASLPGRVRISSEGYTKQIIIRKNGQVEVE